MIISVQEPTNYLSEGTHVSADVNVADNGELEIEECSLWDTETKTVLMSEIKTCVIKVEPFWSDYKQTQIRTLDGLLKEAAFKIRERENG